MAGREVFHVIPRNGAGWDITQEGRDKPVDHAATKDQAVDKGKMLAKMAVTGELIIHGEDGRIESDFIFSDNMGHAPD